MCACVCLGAQCVLGVGSRRPGPALGCRWAGPAAGPAALAALGSRPRRARRAGLGLRGGAGTGSGKQQCSGGGGGALPLQEPSAGRRAGAAASRDRGPRSLHGQRGGESRRGPGATGRRGQGADLRRGDARIRIPDPGPRELLRPPPAAPPRTQTLVHRPPPASGQEPPPLPGTAPGAVLPGTPLLSPPREVCPSCPGAALPAHPTSSVPAFPPHASDAPFSAGCTSGARPAGQGVVEGFWRHRGGGVGRAGWGPGGSALPGSRAYSVVPTSPRGYRPRNRPAPGQKPAQSWPLFPPRLENRADPGGRGEASPVALRRAQQAGSLLSKNAGVEQKAPGKSLPEKSRLEAISPHRGSLRREQDLISSCSL